MGEERQSGAAIAKLEGQLESVRIALGELGDRIKALEGRGEKVGGDDVPARRGEKPWEAEGMSKSGWYKREAAARKKAQVE